MKRQSHLYKVLQCFTYMCRALYYTMSRLSMGFLNRESQPAKLRRCCLCSHWERIEIKLLADVRYGCGLESGCQDGVRGLCRSFNSFNLYMLFQFYLI